MRSLVILANAHYGPGKFLEGTTKCLQFTFQRLIAKKLNSTSSKERNGSLTRAGKEAFGQGRPSARWPSARKNKKEPFFPADNSATLTMKSSLPRPPCRRKPGRHFNSESVWFVSSCARSLPAAKFSRTVVRERGIHPRNLGEALRLREDDEGRQ
jgi:hypothetical protein